MRGDSHLGMDMLAEPTEVEPVELNRYWPGSHEGPRPTIIVAACDQYLRRVLS